MLETESEVCYALTLDPSKNKVVEGNGDCNHFTGEFKKQSLRVC